jgi:hypothetical protein
VATPATLKREDNKVRVDTVPTLFEKVVETDTDFTTGVSGDCQSCLGLDAFFPQVDILLGTRVDNFDVCPLAGTGAGIHRDNYERVIVYRIPQTFLLWPPIGGEVELDGVGWKDKRQEEEEEREPEETRHGEYSKRPMINAMCSPQTRKPKKSMIIRKPLMHALEFTEP